MTGKAAIKGIGAIPLMAAGFAKGSFNAGMGQSGKAANFTAFFTAIVTANLTGRWARPPGDAAAGQH